MLFSFSAISISVFFHQSQVYWIFVSICHSEINFLSDKLNIFSLKAFHVLLSWKTQTSYYNVSARLCYIRALPYSKAFRKCSPNDGWILGWWKTSSYLLSLRPLKSLSTGCCGVMKRQHKWNEIPLSAAEFDVANGDEVELFSQSITHEFTLCHCPI